MEKIDKKQQNLAGKEMKAKKGWKKPEIQIFSIKNTNNNPPDLGNDGSSFAS